MVNEDNRCFLHAEIAAIIRSRNGKPSRIYVARHGVAGPAPSAPCRVCQAAIEEAGIKQVIHT
jgi:deoxycytidylate deaminase